MRARNPMARLWWTAGFFSVVSSSEILGWNSGDALFHGEEDQGCSLLQAAATPARMRSDVLARPSPLALQQAGQEAGQEGPLDDIMGAASAASSAVGMLGAMGESLVSEFKLQGSTRQTINLYAAAAMGFMATATGLGLAADRFYPRAKSSSGQPTYFVLVMISASYVLLIPGLFCTLFSFLIGAEMMGMKVIVSSVHGHPSTITESTVSMVKLLCDTGGWLGAALVVFYAMVVPAVKLVLLIAGEMFREDPATVQKSRRCIHFVQFITKWACPDMFAYILLIYLFRDLDERSSTITALAQLDTGFTCFSLFCVGSTIATLALRPPEDPSSTDSPSNRWSVGPSRLPFVVGVMFVGFLGLLFEGMVRPCMGLRLNSEILFQPNGPLPASAKPMVEMMHLTDQVNTDVSLSRCTSALLRWTLEGEVNCILAMLMLVVFMVALPVVDMCLLLSAAAKLYMCPSTVSDPAGSTMSVVRVLKHCSMLDVAIMGVVVVCSAGAAYQKQGVQFLLLPGLLFLALAEALHYATYYIVRDACHAAANDSKVSSSS
mmetsp:Transcript_67358/g.121368  ORF Transcript_67358/g.121368 Transcript_67358/m.121368 type:complete len:547 (+) Transcript_67358:40-1680(+)